MREHSSKHIEQARVSFTIIKWLAITAFLILPFSFSSGFADWTYLMVAPVAGLLWIVALTYSWRYESALAAGFAFFVVIGAHHLSDFAYTSEPPFGHFLQWLALLLGVAVIPVVFFRSRLLQYCGLQELAGHNKASHSTADRA